MIKIFLHELSGAKNDVTIFLLHITTFYVTVNICTSLYVYVCMYVCVRLYEEK